MPYEKLLSRNKVRARSVPEKVIGTMISKFDMIESWEGYAVEYLVNNY